MKSSGLENYRFGHDAERLFDEQCAQRGIVSERPKDMGTACDRIIRLSSGKSLVVQVKACNRVNRVLRAKGRFRMRYIANNRRENASRTPYRHAGVDVIAVLIGPLARWHLFPAEQYKGKRIKIAPNPIGPMLTAMNNWELLTSVPTT